MKTHEIINVTEFYNENAFDVRLLPSVFFGVLVIDGRSRFTYRIDPSTDGGFDVSIRYMNYSAYNYHSSSNAHELANDDIGCRLCGYPCWAIHTTTVEEAMKFITLDGLFPLAAWAPSEHSGR